MESEWRWNVWKYGLWGHGVGLIAHMLDLPGRWLSNWGSGIERLVWRQDPLAPVPFLIPSFFLLISDPNQHFPYGRIVEPD